MKLLRTLLTTQRPLIRLMLIPVMVARKAYWQAFRPTTRGVRAIVFASDERVVLVKHSYDKFWYLPGGGVKWREDVEKAIRRELFEELGISDLISIRPFAIYQNLQESKRDEITLFVVHASWKASRNSIEIEDARSFLLHDLPVDVSPATKRRLLEYTGKEHVTTSW